MTSFIPSIGSLFFTGALMLIILILIVSNYKLVLNLDFYRKLNLLLLLTIAAGVHGLIHLGLEVNYGFNPYNWIL
jgi:hypothetical protein